jgi:GTP pyrophosphokinase
MFTYLRGFLKGAQMPQSMAALGFAREKHKGYTRKGNGQPYIVHPLWMACYATAIGIRDDSYIAAILLHDVPEDTGTPLSSLPVSDEARSIVDCMTIKKYEGESKWKCKERYYRGLLKEPGAVLCKGVDRYHNLSTMEGDMPSDSIDKNVIETYDLLLPVMKEAKETWPELSDPIFILRVNIRTICDTLNAAHHVMERHDEIVETLKHTPAIPQTNSQ